MLNSGKKTNILTLVLSEKNFLNDTKTIPPFKLIGRSLTKLVFVRIPASRLGGNTYFDFPFL